MKFTIIDIAEIDLMDERFRISYIGPSVELVASIEAAGLINPPVVTAREGRTVVVCGWKRILACQKLGTSEIPVFVSSEESDLELFKNPVYENVSFREMKTFEKAGILKKLQQFGENDEDLIRRFLPLLKVPATRRYLDLFLELARLERELQEILESKGTALTVLEWLLKYSPQERALLLPILLPLGQNKQKELLIQLFEIAQKQGVSPQKILLGSLYQGTLQDDKLSPLQKADRMLDGIREQRSPVFTHWMRTFEGALKAINLEKGVIINPVPFFEGEELNLSFSFKNPEEFLEKISELAKLAAEPEFSNLFLPPSDDE